MTWQAVTTVGLWFDCLPENEDKVCDNEGIGTRTMWRQWDRHDDKNKDTRERRRSFARQMTKQEKENNKEKPSDGWTVFSNTNARVLAMSHTSPFLSLEHSAAVILWHRQLPTHCLVDQVFEGRSGLRHPIRAIEVPRDVLQRGELACLDCLTKHRDVRLEQQLTERSAGSPHAL